MNSKTIPFPSTLKPGDHVKWNGGDNMCVNHMKVGDTATIVELLAPEHDGHLTHFSFYFDGEPPSSPYWFGILADWELVTDEQQESST